MNRKLIAILIGVMIPFLLSAKEKEEKSWGLIPLPVVFYMPETGIAGGILASFRNQFTNWRRTILKLNHAKHLNRLPIAP